MPKPYHTPRSERDEREGELAQREQTVDMTCPGCVGLYGDDAVGCARCGGSRKVRRRADGSIEEAIGRFARPTGTARTLAAADKTIAGWNLGDLAGLLSNLEREAREVRAILVGLELSGMAGIKREVSLSKLDLMTTQIANAQEAERAIRRRLE